MPARPLLSVILATRNEEAYITGALDALFAQDYPHDRLEIIVVDGVSEDATRSLVRAAQDRATVPVRVLDNPMRTTPHAFNIGIQAARGDMIGIAGAHARLPRNWASHLSRALVEHHADFAGGSLETAPADKTSYGAAVAFTLSHPLGVGNGKFRTGSDEVVVADAVGFGLWKREVFSRVGLFNTELTRSQDMDFNTRLRRAGGKIILVPSVTTIYFCRTGIRDTAIYNFRNGYWVSFPRVAFGVGFGWRHYIPGLFVAALIGSLALAAEGIATPLILVAGPYAAAVLGVAASAHDKVPPKAVALLPLAFALLHVPYGFGTLAGALAGLWKRLRAILAGPRQSLT